MCIIERKTYLHSDGRQQVVETPRPCSRAVGSRLCRYVRRRSFEQARVVETKPSLSSTDKNSSDGVIVTESRDGRQRIYRDLSKRSSNSSSVRRSNTMSDRSPISTPSSMSSQSYVEVKPLPPSPLLAFTERTRAPYPPMSPPDPSRIVTPEGTAIYGRPPSLELPRAVNNERPSGPRKESDSSVSSTKAEVDDDLIQPGPSRPRRRPNISIDTTGRPSTSSSSAYASSPGLSDLPGVGRLRSDSGKDLPRRSARKSDRPRAESDRQRRVEQDRRQQDEEDRQARIERERLANSDRRQSAREELARAASRERHREEAAAALEGQQRQREDDPIQRRRDAELAQMDRERTTAAARQRESDQAQRYSVEDQLRRDADARARYDAARSSPTTRRRMTGDSLNYTSPPISARSAYPVALHQYPSARRSSAFGNYGEEVIAREQARVPTERLSNALGGMNVNDDEYDPVDDDYIDDNGRERRRRREHRRWP